MSFQRGIAEHKLVSKCFHNLIEQTVRRITALTDRTEQGYYERDLILTGSRGISEPAQPMAVFATYIPFAEINKNEPSTIEEFHQAIAAFPRTRMLHICSAMNALLRSEDQPVNIAAHDSLVRNLFDDATAASLLQPREEVRFVFYRQQILFIAKTAIMHCTDDDQDIDPDQFKKLGKVLLMAGDHLGTPPKKPEAIPDKFAYFASILLPVQEASGFHRFDYQNGPIVHDVGSFCSAASRPKTSVLGHSSAI